MAERLVSLHPPTRAELQLRFVKSGSAEQLARLHGRAFSFARAGSVVISGRVMDVARALAALEAAEPTSAAV